MTTPPGVHHTRITAPRNPRSVPGTRTRITHLLRRWNLPPTTVDDAELLLSELLTNAVRHGTGPTITVLASYDHGTLHCQVHNDTPHPPPEPPSPATPSPEPPADPLAETGRGLHLVHTLATHWGSYRDPHARQVAWFHLDTTGQTPPVPTTTETDPALLRRVLSALRTL